MVVSALLAIAVFFGVGDESRDGIVHHKWGGMSSRAAEPFFFWLDIILQVGIGLFFTGVAVLAGYFGVQRRSGDSGPR